MDVIDLVSNLPIPDQIATLRKYQYLIKGRLKLLREMALADPARWDGLDHEIVVDERDWHSVRLKEARELLSPEVFEQVVKATKVRYVLTVPKTKTPPAETEGAVDGKAEEG